MYKSRKLTYYSFVAAFLTLAEAIRTFVHDGDFVALEGFTHLIPFAAGQEIIRQGRRKLSIVRMTPDLIYDQLIGAGCVAKLTFSWGGNPGVGSLHRFRDAVEQNWPHPLVIEERSHSDLANAYVAGAANLPFAVLRGYTGSDFAKYNPQIKTIVCPFTGEALAATPAVRPDVTVIHAQKADRSGNVLLWGILGVQKEAVLAARHSIVTVEEVVDNLDAPANACVLPSWVVSAVCVVPRGAKPSYAHGYYARDNAFYRAWEEISRDRERFQLWIQRHILETRDFAESERTLAESFKEVLKA
jgi:glutaconate CoA-transferase subunit A